MDGHHIDLADRKRVALVKRNAQQGTCGHYMIFGRILLKILQAVQSTWHLLYLIEDHQRFARLRFDSRYSLYGKQNALNAIIVGEQTLGQRLCIAVDIGNRFVAFPAKLPHEPRLSYLACTKEKERFPLRTCFPCL